MAWFNVIVGVVTIIGFPLTLAGLVVGFLKLNRTIKERVTIADANTAIKTIDEIKFYLRDNKHEIALLRVADLVKLVIQIKELERQQLDENLKEIISLLEFLENNLERTLNEKILFNKQINLDILNDCRKELLLLSINKIYK